MAFPVHPEGYSTTEVRGEYWAINHEKGQGSLGRKKNSHKKGDGLVDHSALFRAVDFDLKKSLHR